MSQQTIQKVYPLTPMQEGMLYHSVIDPESSFYFTQLELQISGHLDLAILEKSLEHLLRSYDILRTVFVHQDLQRPRQIVFAERQAKIHFENISTMNLEGQLRHMDAYKRENQAKGFNLAKDLLFRVAVFQLGEETYQLIWSNHHILIDGWSLGILMKKLFQYYEAHRAGATLPVASEKPYADYIKWLEKQDKEAAIEYWDKRLTEFEQSTTVPQWHRLSENEGYRNEEFTFSWDEQLVTSIKQVASRYQITTPNLFQAIWGALLSRYNNTDDVVFGTVVSGRPAAINGIENMVGLFINTIPVRLRLHEIATFADLFRAVQQDALEAEPFDYVPLYDIQNRSVLNNRLINHLIAFENYPLDREFDNANFEERLGFSVQVVGTFEQTNYDFNLIAFPGERWTVKIMYNAAVYDRQWIEKVAVHLTNLATAAVHAPESVIVSVCFLSREETQELLAAPNDQQVEYPREQTIQELFEQQATRVPDNVAVAFNDQQLTYRQLNANANRIARVLRDKGVGSDQIVGIMAERSVEMIVGMLAILKAGGAYLPIDPAYPPDRISYMLEDSGTRLLLTQTHLTDLVDFAGEMLNLNVIETADDDAANLERTGSPDDLCYIIYTSGTTGKPKGVMISHRNVVRLLVNDQLQFTFSENDTWTMFHSFCFDFSVWEMYGALLYGGKLVVVPKHIAQSPNEFRELLIRENVTVLNQTPTAFASLIQREMLEPGKQLGIRYVVFGGEALKPLMLKDWYEKYPETKLINMYGITETTVHVTFKEIGEAEIRNNNSNIGVPIPTLGCYIMDKDMNLVPVGVVGELCVAGLGVARGYLHRTELTAERFIDNPHKPGERLYRSGDLARILANGELEYFGRIDHQVKIRGFRIELGEIESQLLRIKPITEAAVMCLNDYQGDQMLCAYFVADHELTVDELRKTLLMNLPDYMVPTHFMQLPEMPVTSNGKLARQALPEPQVGTDREEYLQPTNALEQQISVIWQDVLGVDRIGINDNFFSLGGHSLKAMQLTTKIHQQLERQLPIKVLFERPTIWLIAQYLQEADEETAAAIAPASFQSHYPVSSAQRRMYILSEWEGAGVSYNIPAALLLQGELDKPRLEAAFQSVIDRHETLRTSFEMVEGTLVQTIHKDVQFHLNYKSALEEDAVMLIRSFMRPFDLQQAPLVRAELIRFAEDRHLLLIDMHHIISDGVSTGILVADLAKLYRGEHLPEPKLHYKDFAVWQNNVGMQQDRLQRLEKFWLDSFAGEIPVLQLPTDFPRPPVQSLAGDRFGFGIDEKLAQQIYQLTAETGTTIYMFLLAAFNVFLSKYSSQEEIIVGSPTAGRTHAEITDIPGMFVNTLALRSAPAGNKTFKEFLLEVKETCLQASAHQDYPFEELVEKLALTRDTGRTPLFNVMFNLQNMHIPQLQLGTLQVSPYSSLPVAAKFDLTLEAVEREGRIDLNFDYATALFTQDTIQRWSGHLLQIAQTAAHNPEIPLAEIEMLSPAERSRLLAESSNTGVNYPADQTIQSQFAEQVSRTPERTAIVYEGDSLTYRELDERANRLAWALRERGVGREQPVALLLNRSADMIVAILAVLKAGGAYVPIDPDNSQQRIDFMLQDSRSRCVITQQECTARISNAYNGEIIDIHEEFRITDANGESVEPLNQATDLAYIIYTSGTTGSPKGVMIEHRQVLHLIEGLRSQVYSHYNSAPLHVALVAPFHFDASVQQIFASLLLGQTLFIVPKASVSDGRAIADYYRTHRIDITDGTPAHLQLLLSAAGTLPGIKLRHMLIGGEALPHATIWRLLDLFGQDGTVPAITNVYGPTECCVDASAFDIVSAPAVEHASPYLPIGKPLGNNRLYILDTYGRLQPPGVPGEMCIAGDGVGRGYLNLPELTAEKFVANPFVAGETMYRTGDLARRQSDGTIEFLGRMDHQVKIRGYRIEPSEIETAMLKHNQVTTALVIANSAELQAQELCVYFTADNQLTVSELRDWLSIQLPTYMVPAYFVQIESIPLTANGKINRHALPAPDAVRTAATNYVAPQSEMERLLCLIWQETLGMERIGIDDNFFDLGGHSLKAIMLIGNIQTKINRDIPIKLLFDRPTIRQLANHMDDAATGSSVYQAIEPVQKQDYYPVSSAQKRMYILQQFADQGVSYNMPSVLLLEGELDIERLERAFNDLLDRHESLRTSFMEIEGTPVQKVHDQVKFQLSMQHGTEEAAAELIRQLIRPFDLCSAPLFRAGLIRFSENQHLLVIDLHHIIADGVSGGIFVRELARLYNGNKLPAPRLHYKDFTMWQNEPEQQESIQQQGHFWLDKFSGVIPELKLPTDFPRPAVQSFAGDAVRFDAAKELTQQIHSLTSETGTTLHMVLVAIFNIFLAKLSGQEDIVIGSAVAARAHADVRDIPGMFVNTLALRNAPAASKTFRQFLQEVKEDSLQAMENQDYPFEELIRKLDLPRDISRNPLFNVMLTVENADTDILQLDLLSISPYELPTETSKFDLTLAAFEGSEGIGVKLEYCTDLFTKETIIRWSSYFLNVMRTIAENPDAPLSEIELLAAEEKRQILVDWNRTEQSVPTDKTIHELFQDQVLRTPDQIAVVHNGERWTYRELNARANRLARVLIRKGIGPDQRVGIMVKPSLQMAAGVLAILKAGGAFVPIDPDYPEQRIAYMLADSGAPILLTQTDLTVTTEFGGEVIWLDGELPCSGEESDFVEEQNPVTAAASNNLAYIIYTSGTTGQPKGVMIEHQSLVNLCFWHNETFAVTEGDCSAKYAGFGFDASVWEMFPYWITGAQVHIIDETIRMDIMRLNEYFEQNAITVTFLPTQLCEHFMELDNRSLRILLTGGDKLKRVRKQRYTLVNNYGPTESTVVASSAIIKHDSTVIPIGRPISNTRLYILGKSDQVQPVGVAGELCIAGRGLARGYINRLQETANKFVADPFVPGERMYRTGDLARWMADGSIEYFGRVDQQVKVRGFRIELSEIELHLAQHPSVNAAIVTDVQDAYGNTALCAYVVSAEQFQVDQVQQDLARLLPEYMLPKYWVELDSLPMTQNGKVDRRALPKPDLNAAAEAYKAPRNETEALLAEVWQDVLGLQMIGISDNFFALGGDSIKAIQMASRLHKQGWKLEMKHLFQHPTIEQVSPYLDWVQGKQADQSAVEGEVLLTPIQRWFFEKRFTSMHHWNQSVMLHAPAGFDSRLIEQTIGKITEHHDALRMVFKFNDDGVKQYNRGPKQELFTLQVVDLRASSDIQTSIMNHVHKIHGEIGLNEGPLVKLALYKTTEGDHLLIVIHHLVVDGVSWRILLEDFASGYLQAEHGEQIVLQDKTNSFKEWAEQLNEYANTDTFLKQADYWRDIESKRLVRLPKDNAVRESRVKDSAAISFELTEEETQLLLTQVHRAYHTEMNDILLCALGLTVQEWTNQAQICINLEAHGREEILPGMNVARTIGWFSAQYPVLLELDQANDLPMLIKTVKESLRRIPDKGIGYGLLRYETADEYKSGIDFSLKPEISFNYLGQFDSEVHTSFFQPSVYDSGYQLSPDSESLYALDFSGIVRSGSLVISCTFNKQEYLKSTIAKLTERFKCHLLTLIHHCVNTKDTDRTPSDFSANDLKMDEIEDIFDLLAEKLS